MRDQTPYIEVHAGAREHRKIAQFAALLNVPYAHALGALVALWASPYTMNHRGNLAGCDDAYIASLAKWEGPVNGFVGYLKTSQLLDDDMAIHDYPLHGTRLLEAARARVNKCRAEKQAQANMKRSKKRK